MIWRPSQGASAFGWLASQANACERILKECLDASIGRGVPADKFLGGVFRGDRTIGSRDRKLYSLVAFAVFRWRGWLMKMPEAGSSIPLMILGALAAEGAETPASAIWLETSGISPDAYSEILSMDSPKVRLGAFATLCKSEATFESLELIPEWSIPMLSKEAGDERLIDMLQMRPPLWLRVCQGAHGKVKDAFLKMGFDASFHRSLPDALKVSGSSVNLHSVKEFKDGLFEVQDLSSQCIGLVCDPAPGELWWDACAGAGGKSLQIADMSKGLCKLFASDIREGALEELRKRAARASLKGIRTKLWNGGSPPFEKSAKFDGVLVDAPCSSSGRWRRNPDARWIARKSWVGSFPKRQLELLLSASEALKPGGILLYATCSMFEMENRSLVSSFLEARRDFSPEPFKSPLDGGMTDGTLAVMPWDGDCDAAFVARLRRRQ